MFKLYTLDGSRLLQAFTENVREKYIIKRHGIKNDLSDPSISHSPTQVTYLLEMACNEMFGNFIDGFNSQVDMHKEFKLEKCEIGLFNRRAWDLFFNFELLKEAAEQFEKTQSGRGYECLYKANETMDRCYPRYDKEQRQLEFLYLLKALAGQNWEDPFILTRGLVNFWLNLA